MLNDYYAGDNVLSYLCIVDISDDDYKISIYTDKDNLIFEGTLDEFSEQYDEIY